MSRRIYQLAAVAMLTLYPGSLALAASGSGLLQSFAEGVEGQPREARRAAALPVAEALVHGDRNEYHQELGALDQMLDDPDHLRSLGPLAEQLDESWQAREDQRAQRWRQDNLRGMGAQALRSLAFGSFVGLPVAFLLGVAGMPALAAIATGVGVVAALDFLIMAAIGAPGAGAPGTDRRRPADVLPMARVRADAVQEAGQEAAQQASRGGDQQPAPASPGGDRRPPACDPDSALPSFDCLEGGD